MDRGPAEGSDLMRHVVAIFFDLQRGKERRQVVYSAFAFSVRGRWLLMTAGHCVSEMQKLREYGYKLLQCQLLDGLSPRAVHKQAVPFPYDSASPMNIGCTEAHDYGVLILPHNTCALLEANGVVPFDERWWEEEPADVAAFFLLGIPNALTKASTTQVELAATKARLEKLSERPEGFVETDAPMFYGRLLDNPFPSLRGFSGSPIISVSPPHRSEQARYWLHAMQVSALGDQVSGMLMPPLGRLLAEMADGKHRCAQSHVQ